LVVEEKTEMDLVDNRALQTAKLEPLSNNAADFRVWKNTLILMLGRLDISGIDYLTNWIAVAFRLILQRSAQTPQALCRGLTDGSLQSLSKV
jgi:hypothetical protein